MLAIIDHEPVNVAQGYLEFAIEKGEESVLDGILVKILGSYDEIGYLCNRHLLYRCKGSPYLNVANVACGPSCADKL